MISTTRHRFSFDSGRVSMIRTTSPTRAEFSSSCAWYFFVRTTCFEYSGCETRRSTATTTVLFILSLTTVPIRTFRRPLVFSVVISAIGLRPLPLVQDRLHPRHITTELPDQCRILELLRRGPNPQPEQLLPRLRDPLLDRFVRQLPDLRRVHALPPSATASRTTTRHLTGSFAAASSNARRATGSATPSSSNITRPGFTTATQYSGFPFPFPMRVSAGFFVIGLSGKIRIQTLPPRLMWRVIATRAASICRFVIHPGSSDCRPNSPNATVFPR